MITIAPIRQASAAPTAQDAKACGDCQTAAPLPFAFSYAYQPIVDVMQRQVFAHEALVRGPRGEPAMSVLEQVTDDNCYRFDQACRTKAIKTAAQLKMGSLLSINFMPNAIYRPELCIRSTLAAAKAHGFPIDRIIFETVEGERVNDGRWLAEIMREYKRIGFRTAIDDFGAGYAGLNLLADFQPDIVKLDMALVRGVDASAARQAIVRGTVAICDELQIQVIAEGVETVDEYRCLHDMGIRLMQGYLFSRPVFETCVLDAAVQWPAAVVA